jgi:hypothetical protein
MPRLGGSAVTEQRFQRSMSEHQDVIGAYASSALAAIIMRYVASAPHPAFGHAVLALLPWPGFSRRTC